MNNLSHIGCLWSVEVSSCTFQQDTNLSLTPLINTVGSSITWEQEVVECWGWAVARSDVSGFVFITDTLWALLSQCQHERDGGLACFRLTISTEWERERGREGERVHTTGIWIRELEGDLFSYCHLRLSLYRYPTHLSEDAKQFFVCNLMVNLSAVSQKCSGSFWGFIFNP